MLFNSIEYLGFFTVTLTAAWLLIGFPRLRIWMLLFASYYFYVSNNSWLLVLILISTVIDYVAALAISRSRDDPRRKLWLTLSVVTNLGILGYFKYFDFFRSSITDALGFVGWELSWVDLNIALPVGISFYTFQSMSYTIDVYRGVLAAERSWQRFAFYVAFFPQLIAGPIVRATQFLPQIDRRPQMDVTALSQSLFRIFKGLIKKIVLADYLATYADAAFNDPSGVDSFSAWLGVYAFTLQIYFDFSGYTDIAIGSARLLGYDLPENFRRPYLAVNITEFWRRWHISLSTWLRDYLYIPLGGNRTGSAFGTYRNLMLTMLLGGLWHGAAWNFVLWGGLHGLLLGLERARGVSRGSHDNVQPEAVERLVKGALVFQLCALLWIPFRSEDLGSMTALLGSMFSFEAPEIVTVGMLVAVAIVAFGWMAQVYDEFRGTMAVVNEIPLPVMGLAYGVCAAAIVVFNSGGTQAFIYFRF